MWSSRSNHLRSYYMVLLQLVVPEVRLVREVPEVQQGQQVRGLRQFQGTPLDRRILVDREGPYFRVVQVGQEEQVFQEVQGVRVVPLPRVLP